MTLDWDRGRMFDKDVALAFHDRMRETTPSSVKVISVKEKEKAKQRPQALNTIELLRVGSARLGIGPQQTMQLAERLYIQVGRSVVGFLSFINCFATRMKISNKDDMVDLIFVWFNLFVMFMFETHFVL